MTCRKLKVWLGPDGMMLVIENSQKEAIVRLAKNGIFMSLLRFQTFWRLTKDPKYADIARLPAIWQLCPAGWEKR